MPLPWEKNEVMRRSTITELVNAWRQSETDIREAFSKLKAAKDRLQHFFDGSCRRFDIRTSRHSYDSLNFEPEGANEAIAMLKQQVWASIVDRLELRRILSLKRIKELDGQIESGEGLPEITFENVTAMLETNFNCAPQYLEEKVRETYELLRPNGWRLAEYKTNQKSAEAGVGSKLVICRAVERTFRRDGGFDVNYHRRDELRALDQVFHLLDGAEQPRSHYGEIVDAVAGQTSRKSNEWETPYFRGRCFKNGNLHMEFKRQDLLDLFNRVAGGMRLTDVKAAAQAQ